jgi:hypothetical protein
MIFLSDLLCEGIRLTYKANFSYTPRTKKEVLINQPREVGYLGLVIKNYERK